MLHVNRCLFMVTYRMFLVDVNVGQVFRILTVCNSMNGIEVNRRLNVLAVQRAICGFLLMGINVYRTVRASRRRMGVVMYRVRLTRIQRIVGRPSRKVLDTERILRSIFRCRSRIRRAI